jgi:hypothetical protein
MVAIEGLLTPTAQLPSFIDPERVINNAALDTGENLAQQMLSLNSAGSGHVSRGAGSFHVTCLTMIGQALGALATTKRERVGELA